MKSSQVKKQPIVQKKNTWKKVGVWAGWAAVYLFVFYLGNLSGEYVAARMPIGSLSLKPTWNISLPKISFAWHGFDTSWMKKKEVVSLSTKPVVVAGRVFALPLETASQEERMDFESSVRELAQAVNAISVSSCELSVAFVQSKKDSKLMVSNVSQSSSVVRFEQNDSPVEIKSQETVAVEVGNKPGVYSIFCDEALAGFSVVSE
jgi:hypothetical protein